MTASSDTPAFSPTPPLEPIRPTRRVRWLEDEQLDRLQDATLKVLEEVGVKFPDERSLDILAAHGCHADRATQVVTFPRDVVRRAMATVPRTFTMAARNPDFDLRLEEGTSYYTLDGCGVAALDPETRVERPSRKSDLEAQARVADWLPGIGFIWPTVSAQDHGRTSQLHEIDAVFNNTVKHFQAMVMGEDAARFAVEMATVVAGTPDELRRRPVLSNLVCSVAPLAEEHTRTHMKTSLRRGLERDLVNNRYRDPVEVARERAMAVRASHRPEPLETAKRAELTRILGAARGVLG